MTTKTRQTRINADLYTLMEHLAPTLGCSGTRDVIEFACRLLLRNELQAPHKPQQAPSTPTQTDSQSPHTTTPPGAPQ